MNPHLAKMGARLREILDEEFPKVEEEGPEKTAMKRGPALLIYAEAMIQAQIAIKEAIKDYKALHCSECLDCVPGTGKCDMHDGYVEKPNTI